MNVIIQMISINVLNAILPIFAIKHLIEINLDNANAMMDTMMMV